MSYKDDNLDAYNTYANYFDPYFQESFDQIVKSTAQLFLTYVKQGKLLDLGSGPGNHAKFFQEQGLEVVCLDNSPSMLKLCQEKGLKTLLMDIEDLNLGQKEFDAIWAFASLLHIPREKAAEVFKKLSQSLKPGGILSLAVKEGRGQQYEDHKKFPGVKRWFVYYGEEEIRKIARPFFDEIYFKRNDVQGRYTFLHYFFRKRED